MMSLGTRRMDGRVSALLGLLPILLLHCVSGALADGNVTIESITIFKKHEWIGKPTVYFRCRNEDKKYLADVVHKDRDYEFEGHESFQPLTTLHGEKCKRCGIYEQDKVKNDDTFFEAELCPDDFAKSPLGRLVFFRRKEVNATLLCPDCIPRTSEESVDTGTQSSADVEEDEDNKGAGIAFVIVILLIVLLFILGSVAYSKWRQKQRREQQARFVKMFEDDDELDAEFGLKDDDL